MNDRHICNFNSPNGGYGTAIDECYECEDGTFWVSNGEYSSQVNYCPVCGEEAPKRVGDEK